MRSVQRLLPAFAEHLQLFDRGALELTQEVAYGILPDNRLGYVNPAWEEFAEQNDGPGLTARFLGKHLSVVLPASLRDFYLVRYQHVRESGEPWECVFQCPSPREQRSFRMRVLPAGNGGLLITNALIFRAPHEAGKDEAQAVLEQRYRDARGMVVQCSHCRRVRRAADPDTWDFVPALVAHYLENTSHSVCKPCLHHVYLHQHA